MLSIIKKEARKVKKWAIKNGAPDDLSGWCAICSFELFKRLKLLKIRTYFCVVFNRWETHCFIMWKDNLIDVTVSQFNDIKEPIIMPVEKCKGYWFWDMRRVNKYTCIRDIKRVLSNWPIEQNPFRAFKCG